MRYSSGLRPVEYRNLPLETAAGGFRLYQVSRGFPRLMPVWRCSNLSSCFSQKAERVGRSSGKKIAGIGLGPFQVTGHSQ